jgi:hypothetical protein
MVEGDIKSASEVVGAAGKSANFGSLSFGGGNLMSVA